MGFFCADYCFAFFDSLEGVVFGLGNDNFSFFISAKAKYIINDLS